jgi:uncharacterized DUF497 family protein
VGVEWDETKRLATIEKHGIDVIDAERLFDGRPAIRLRRVTSDETRYLTMGVVDERFLPVVWTSRGDGNRII